MLVEGAAGLTHSVSVSEIISTPRSGVLFGKKNRSHRSKFRHDVEEEDGLCGRAEGIRIGTALKEVSNVGYKSGSQI